MTGSFLNADDGNRYKQIVKVFLSGFAVIGLVFYNAGISSKLSWFFNDRFVHQHICSKAND
jgi:hypothetical protein